MRTRTLSLGKGLQTKKIPRSPGIYFFIGKNRKALYIGKAADLRVRLGSYFGNDAGEKAQRLVSESVALKFKETDSEIAALVEEVKYIKRTQPKYNILWRDDKNYFFVGITKETFPRIFLTHQLRKKGGANFLGPFVSGRSLKHALKLIRQRFPYCTCKTMHARTCLETQLGLCPGYCCKIGNEISEKEKRAYGQNIRALTLILSGKGQMLSKTLRREIAEASCRAHFERAHGLNARLKNLEKIFAHKNVLESFWTDESAPKNAARILGELLTIAKLSRIEMYDVSMISGTNAVGAMIVFEEGKTKKTEWRLFEIKRASSLDDPAMIGEVLSRRLSHPEWDFPDLFLIDGGKGQLGAARKALAAAGIFVASAAIAKGTGRKHETLFFSAPVRELPFSKLPNEVQMFLRSIQSEAHRFAISYHRKKRKAAFRVQQFSVSKK